MKETKRERFVRIAEQRTQRILDDLKALGKCSNAACYEYTEKDLAKIFAAIDQEVQATRETLAGQNRFTLSKSTSIETISVTSAQPTTQKYIAIQNEVISKYRIEICDGSKCQNDWQRTHAHVKQRRVCKWKQANSAESTFTLFHEIGHIETTTSSMRRCESEYYATVWAIDRMREYGIVDKVSDKTKKLYQNYILRELDRGLRRGGSGYPSKEKLTLNW